ncbi:ABC transporter substrate-binding protein [Arthrobacter sp. D1-29]
MMHATTTHTRRLIAAAGAAVALVLAGCTADPEGGEAGEGGTIRVAYLATGSALPLFVTAEKYAEEAGVNVELVEVTSGNESITGVATGQYDAGFAGIGSAAYNAFAEGLPVQYVAPMHFGYIEDYFIISSQLAGSNEEAAKVAEDMSQLTGQAFAANAPGVVTEALLGFALERGGLSIDQIRLEYIPFPDQVPALANGAIAGGILSEPFPTQAEQNGSGYRPWETPTDDPPLPFTGVIYNTDWAEQNRQAAEDFMRAYAKTAEDLADNGWNTEEMLALVEKYTGANPEVIAASRQHHIPADLSVDFDVLRRYQEFFMERGSLKYNEIIPDEEMWNFTWRDAALGN